MADPVLSPDGRYMWINNEWVLLPEDNHPTQPTNDVINKNPIPTVSMQDSVVSGGINITQNIGPDVKELVTSMLTELDKFDTSKSGFHIPDGGFSATFVINAIIPIKSDITILQNFSTEHLLEFCTALESIGYSEIGLTATNIILERAKSSQNKELMAKAYIFKSEFLECVIRNRDSLSHAIEAAIISRELGNKTLESEALYLVVEKLKSAKKDTSNYAKRIDELLLDTSELDYSSYAYLLTAKAQVIEYTDPNHSEELEQQALKYAKETGDVRLQLYVYLHMVHNEVIVPTKSDTDDLRRLCAVNGMKAYVALLDLISVYQKMTEGLDRLADVSNKMKQLSDELEVPYYGFLGEIFFVTGLLVKAHNICMDTGEIESLEPALNDERVVNLFQKCVGQDIYELDDTLLYALLCIRSTVYLVSQVPSIDINIHPSVKNYTMVGRENLITDEGKFMFKILEMLDRGVPIDQLTHMCLPSNNDNDMITGCKELISHNIDILKNAAGKELQTRGLMTSSDEMIEDSQLDIAQSYNPNKNSEFTAGLFKLGWGVLLCIAPFVLMEMTGGIFIWWGLWIWGGIEILIGLSKMFSD